MGWKGGTAIIESIHLTIRKAKRLIVKTVWIFFFKVSTITAWHFCVLISPKQFTSIRILLVIDGFLEDPTEMKRKPTEGKDDH